MKSQGQKVARIFLLLQEKLFHFFRALMSTNASILVDSVGPPSAGVCRTASSFP
jgi:hypothetical protein